MRKSDILVLFCAAGLGMAGCATKHIVRAAPPSVSAPPPDEAGPMPTPVAPPPVETTNEPPPEPALVVPPAAPTKRPTPPRPRSAPAETAEPAPVKPAPPQISPQLSEKDLESAKASTTANITTAEKNLHQADGRALNAAQKDLFDKTSGFLAQAHEAILADDWVRALNLAEKARVLSAELVKSF
jgi:hypothetical protein